MTSAMTVQEPGCDTDPTANHLADHHRTWIATCLADGYSSKSIIAKLVSLGYRTTEADAEVTAVSASPLLEAVRLAARRRDKLASLLDALGRQLRRSPVADRVPVETECPPGRFFERYYYSNRPVVIRGLMDRWAARRRWSLEWFAECFGDEEVEVTADRQSDPLYEDNFASHRQLTTMRSFVERATGGGGNDVYLVAKNKLLEREAFVALRDDFEHPAGFLDGDRAAQAPRLWLGGAGTVTPLHHDASNIFFGQVLGTKRVRLVPPYEIEHLANDRTCFSSIDLDNPDFGRYPSLRQVLVLDVVVEPGDFLLLPIGWWHTVRSLEASISLSFQNFATTGSPVVWHHPS